MDLTAPTRAQLDDSMAAGTAGNLPKNAGDLRAEIQRLEEQLARYRKQATGNASQQKAAGISARIEQTEKQLAAAKEALARTGG